MFALNKASEAVALPVELSEEQFLTWRWLPESNYFLDEQGLCKAKSSAFDIKRDENDDPIEPSASLFQLKREVEPFSAGVVAIFKVLPFGKKTLENTAVGALKSEKLLELKSDPMFKSMRDGSCFFNISVSEKQHRPKLIHWDLEYSLDDREKEIQALKTVLARICMCSTKP